MRLNFLRADKIENLIDNEIIVYGIIEPLLRRFFDDVYPQIPCCALFPAIAHLLSPSPRRAMYTGAWSAQALRPRRRPLD